MDVDEEGGEGVDITRMDQDDEETRSCKDGRHFHHGEKICPRICFGKREYALYYLDVRNIYYA